MIRISLWYQSRTGHLRQRQKKGKRKNVAALNYKLLYKIFWKKGRKEGTGMLQTRRKYFQNLPNADKCQYYAMNQR